ncbi:MAG: M23 family metallopeptidase [Candidatus Schekmanbacteria bacterium]|nr:M23 family metallopeptidase [Candidatus Schekmanbacteria bacterium]
MGAGGEYYSIIVTADWERRSRLLSFPRWAIRASVIGGVVAAVAFCLLAGGYASVRSEVRELERQRDRDKEVAQRMQGLVRQIDTIQMKLDEIAGMRGQITQMLGLHGQRSAAGASGGGIGVVGQESDLMRVFRGKERELVGTLATDLGSIDHELEGEIGVHRGLQDLLRERTLLLESIPSIRPVTGGYISSGFSRRRDPITGSIRMHKGLDIASSERVPVAATGEGVVVFAGFDGGFGNMVAIDHGFGFVTRYAHLARISVSAGDPVQRGQELGLLGNTGRSTGPHLHYEVLLEGIPIDPSIFILDGNG